MSSKKNNPNIKVKLLLGYSLTIIALIIAGFITYISFTKLFDSVETLARPDTKLIMLNHMLTDISEAEGSLRSYILSNEKAHLQAYEIRLDSIMNNISALKYASAEDPTQLNKLDSISILLKAKYDAIDDLAALAQRSRSNNFSTTALDQIQATRFDSAKIDTTLMTYTETTTYIKPRGIIDEEEKKPEPKGLLQAIRNLFGSKNEENTPSSEENMGKAEKEDDYYTETKVTVDTSIVSAFQTDSILSNIKKILSDVQRQESALNRLLNAKQLEVLEQDRMIMDKIRLLVTSLERREILKAEEQTQQAKALADKFSFTILAVGILGLLAGTVFVLLILHDINKSNYYKEQLEKAKNKAEHLAKAKEEFLANMSHEIRTPLNAIQGFTEQLLQTSLQGNQQEYLQAVQQSSEHLLATVNDILDFSKIEVGKLAIEKIPFQPQKILEEVHTLLKLKASEKNLAFNYFVDEDCPKNLIGDPFRLKQILFNLVGNALKFTESGSVFITCKSRKAFSSPKRVILSIEVKDTGVGISKQNIEKIFEGFQQADSSTTRQFGGTGLGLTICKNLVELQQGVLLVESEEGKGSTFTINIPYELSTVEAEGTRRPHTVNTAMAIQGTNILIVDDDDLNLLLLNTILSKHGAITVQAKSGMAGIEKIKEQSFDLIITDIQMPQMSGFEFAKALRRPDSGSIETPIIGLSAHVTHKEKQLANKAGITEMLSKPFKETFLLERIIAILGLKPIEVPSEKHHEGENNNCFDVPGYNLSSFDSFTKGDKKVLITLLDTLVKDQKKNLELLKIAVEKNDFNEISALAHKMTASFGYLKAVTIVDKLNKLEMETKEENDDLNVKEMGDTIVKEASLVITDLEKNILSMRNESLPA